MLVRLHPISIREVACSCPIRGGRQGYAARTGSWSCARRGRLAVRVQVLGAFGLYIDPAMSRSPHFAEEADSATRWPAQLATPSCADLCTHSRSESRGKREVHIGGP